MERIEFKNLPVAKAPRDRLSAVEVNQIVDTLKGILRSDIRSMINRGVDSGITAPWVWASNTGDEVISTFRPVGITGQAFTGTGQDHADKRTTEVVLDVVNPKESTDNFEGHYAIAAERIAPGDNGRVWINGIVPVWALSTGEEDGEGNVIEKTYAELLHQEDDEGNPDFGKDYLTCSTGGSSRVIWKKENSDDEQLIMVRLGFASLVMDTSTILPVKITSKVNFNTYIGDEYGDGTDAGATASSVTIRVLQIGADETIPNETELPAWLQKWGGVLFRTVNVARDY